MSILSYSFMQNALISSVLVSIICGVLGPFIAEKKMLNLSAGLAHSAYGGVGLGYLLGFEPMLGALIFAVGSAVSIGFIRQRSKTSTDTLVSLFWSGGMALGIIFVSLMSEYPPNMSSYLFGNILSISDSNILVMLLLTILVVIVVYALFNDFLSYIFDREFAYINGINVKVLDYIFLILIAIGVIIMIHTTGVILVLALLASPTAISKFLSKNIKTRMLFSTLFSVVFCLLGLFISYELNIPSGAAIVCVSIVAYFLFFIFKNKKIVND